MISSNRKGVLFTSVAIWVVKRHAVQERGEEEQVLSGLSSKLDPWVIDNATKRKQWVKVTADLQKGKGFCTAARLAVLKSSAACPWSKSGMEQRNSYGNLAIAILSFVDHLHGRYNVAKRGLQQIKANYKSPGTKVNDSRPQVLIQGKGFGAILWINT